MVAFNKARVADGLTLAAASAREQRAPWHCLELRRFGMGDVLAAVAADAEGGHAVEVAIDAAYSIKV
ncbi:hypothetical protein [Stenotrophomonas sp. DDT-1]|uniref:hypothetical protein n=1 Tax=Stenotrophomonas sp. DDT-1 TaxID=1609637 RepID=UPI0012E8721E|nr:hypothetical protein [Stenotrophomonas sp. DDT-1]